MAFYDLSKQERSKLVAHINTEIYNDLCEHKTDRIIEYFSDEDTYTRKTAYLAIGKLYKVDDKSRANILKALRELIECGDEKVRQTVINAAGEIGMTDFEVVVDFFDIGLFDKHHKVRNAVIGSIKKMGAKNPKTTLQWAEKYLGHPDKEVRREICHGIELRGRTHPQDILPLLEKLQYDPTSRIRNTLVHVLGQISYKKGCLKTVISALNEWGNAKVVKKAIDEIVDVHKRYKGFAILSQQESIDYIALNSKKKQA